MMMDIDTSEEVIFIKRGGQLYCKYDMHGSFQYYLVRFENEITGKKEQQSFSLTKYATQHDAKMAAIEYRQVESDLRGLSITFSTSSLSNEEKSYFAGFFDGDGSVIVNNKGHVVVTVAQSQTNGIPILLRKLQMAYGGKIYTRVDSNKRKTQRRAHNWNITGFASLPFLKDMKEYAVLKARQAKYVFEYMIAHESPNCMPIYHTVKSMKTLTSYQNEYINKSRINLPYIAGLVDAEGCVRVKSHNALMSTSIIVKISQSSSVMLLHHINEFFGGLGSINDHEVYWHAQNAVNVLHQLHRLLVGKHQQAAYAIELHGYSRIHRKHYTPQLLARIKFLNEQIKALKKI